jgi:hypothetical protein
LKNHLLVALSGSLVLAIAMAPRTFGLLIGSGSFTTEASVAMWLVPPLKKLPEVPLKM